MKSSPGTSPIRDPAMIHWIVLFLILVLPIIVGLTAGTHPARTFGYVIAILLLQGLAPTAGIGMGLPVPQLLVIATSVATGVILGISRVCDLFSERSARITMWIAKIRVTMEKYQVLKKYGEYMLIPVMWVPGIGLYGTPIVAWVLHWRGTRALLLMLTGWLIACLTVIGVTEGILASLGL
jgi:hypothetical protein